MSTTNGFVAGMHEERAMLADCCLSEALYLSAPTIEMFHSTLANNQSVSHSGFQLVLAGNDMLLAANRMIPSRKQECALFLWADCNGGLAPCWWRQIKHA